jgi:hypothetical protein
MFPESEAEKREGLVEIIMDELQHSRARSASRTDKGSPPDFEVLSSSGDTPPFHLPVAVKSLSAGGVILEVHYPPEGLDLRELQGKGGVVHLPASGNGKEMAVRGKVLWARPQASDNPNFLLGLELEEPTLEVRQALEDHLPINTRDIKELWDQWDRFQEKTAPRASPATQGIYVVGLGVVLGGVALQMWGPENYKSFGFILVLYGCVALAVKSIWSIWQQRHTPKSQEQMALDR